MVAWKKKEDLLKTKYINVTVLLYMHHTTFQLKDVTFAITMFGCGQSDKLVFDILWYDVSMFCCIHFRDDSKIVTRVTGVGVYALGCLCVCCGVCVVLKMG